MPVYKARKGSESYGHAIGILLEDIELCPFIPGDVGNAETFRFPVTYRTIKGSTIENMLYQNGAGLDTEIVAAAKDLENRGVKGITSNCGFFLRFQSLVAKSVHVPVLLSSLLQLPLMLRSVGEGRSIAVITAHSDKLDHELLSLAGVPRSAPIVIAGMQDEPEFASSMLQCTGRLDSDRLEAEVVRVARETIKAHPSVSAVLLECADLPPYAAAVQAATGLPVYDFTTLIELLFAGQHRRRFDPSLTR